MDPNMRGRIITYHRGKFCDEIASWRLNKRDPSSPLLPKKVRDILLNGFDRHLETFQRLVDHPERTPLGDAARAAEGALLMRELTQALHEELNLNGGNSIEVEALRTAARGMTGSVIGRAIVVGKEIGLPHDVFFTPPDLLDGIERSSDPTRVISAW